MFIEGALLLERVASGVSTSPTDAGGTAPGPQADKAVLKDAITALGDRARPIEARLAAAESEPIAQVFAAHPLRDLLTVEGPYPFFADHERVTERAIPVVALTRA